MYTSTYLKNTVLTFLGVMLLNFACWTPLQAQGCSQPSNLNATNLSPTSVNLSWSAIQGSFNYTVQYRVGTTGTWITAGTTTATNLTLTGLLESTTYTWRVRASCSVYSSVATFNTGGSGNNTSCSQPSNLNATNLSPTSVNLSWSAIQGAFDYTVQYRVGTTGTWITAGTTTATNLTLTGLLESTTYTWRVRASCSVYSSEAIFNTGSTSGGGGGSTSCSAPSNTNTNVVQPTSAVVSWEPQGGALNYTVQYRLANSISYVTVGTVTASIITITGLQPGREYVWRVKANCSPYGSDVQFSTPALVFMSTSSNNISVPAAELSIFPNPASDRLQIQSAAPGSQVLIFDATGRLLINDVIHDDTHNIDVSTLRNGMYLIQIRTDNQPAQSRKLLITK